MEVTSIDGVEVRPSGSMSTSIFAAGEAQLFFGYLRQSAPQHPYCFYYHYYTTPKAM